MKKNKKNMKHTVNQLYIKSKNHTFVVEIE